MGVELLGAAKPVVFFNTRIAASRPTRSSEGEPSCALRHPSCLKHSSQPLSDDKNILDYVLWAAVPIQIENKYRTDGNPTTIRARPDRNSVNVYHNGVVRHPIHQSSRTVRDILLSRENVKLLCEG